MVRLYSTYKSPICDSYVRPAAIVRICDECNFGSFGGRCIVCGAPGVSVSFPLSPLFFSLTMQDAYYCAECTRLEKDRDGCPKAINLGHTRMDAMFNQKMQNTFQRG